MCTNENLRLKRTRSVFSNTRSNTGSVGSVVLTISNTNAKRVFLIVRNDSFARSVRKWIVRFAFFSARCSYVLNEGAGMEITSRWLVWFRRLFSANYYWFGGFLLLRSDCICERRIKLFKWKHFLQSKMEAATKRIEMPKTWIRWQK